MNSTTIREAAEALRSGETTSEQLVNDMFAASDRLDETLGRAAAARPAVHMQDMQGTVVY